MVYFTLRCLYIYSSDINSLQNYTRQTCKRVFAKWFALCGESFTVYRGNTIMQFVSTFYCLENCNQAYHNNNEFGRNVSIPLCKARKRKTCVHTTYYDTIKLLVVMNTYVQIDFSIDNNISAKSSLWRN